LIISLHIPSWFYISYVNISSRSSFFSCTDITW